MKGLGHDTGDAARLLRVLLLMTTCALWAGSASAQIGALVSPGRLNRAHAALEGLGNCLSCHAAGQRVSAEKCLGCHKPVASRIAKKRGVHRGVTTDCVTCHVEHAGVDGELRPFNQGTFNHAAETGFPLDGQHAALKASCAACHKARSFLTLTASCASCHTDAHKGSLGLNCATCHTTSIRFAATKTSFDHRRTAFPLTGSHAGVACSSCHQNNVYSAVKFESCANCHTDVHRQRFGATCTGCHTTATWRTTRMDHSRTAFPLRGRHDAVACAQCHTSPAMTVKPASNTCATCHADPHRGQFKQDCSACHTEAGFRNASFDHSTTKFPLVDKHAGLPCARCHTAGPAVPALASPAGAAGAAPPRPPPRSPIARAPSGLSDYRGLTTACRSCHDDVHRGELGASCETCHSARTFRVTAFTHRAQRTFFAGQHAPLTCAQCHLPAAVPAANRSRTLDTPVHVGFTKTSSECASCHRDVHLGQVGAQCETCHSVATPRFGLTGFTHDRTKFPLTGRHEQVMCVGCHKVDTRQFPAGHGEARRLTGIGTECATCHQDVHGGDLSQRCEQCHTTQTFAIEKYTHRNARALHAFFAGRHLTATCEGCHKPARGPAAAARLPPSFRATTSCVSCHTDVHKGALGPRCESCHRL